MIATTVARVFSFLVKPAGRRPSFLWRMFWALFVYHIGKGPDGGAKLQAIVPYILAGYNEPHSVNLVDGGRTPNPSVSLNDLSPAAESLPTSASALRNRRRRRRQRPQRQ